MRRQSDVGYLPAADDGPLVAGGLIRWDLLGASWRLIFFINLLLGAAAITAGLRYLPADGPATLRRLDGRGVAISAAAVPTRLPADPGPPGWLAMVDVRPPRGTGLFARHERRSAAPLIEPALLRRRTYLAGSAVALAFFAASAGIMLVLSFTLSTASDTAPSVPGPMLTPAAAGNVTGALAAMRLYTPPRRTGDHPGQPGRRRSLPRQDHLTRRVTARRAHPGRPYPGARLRARRNIAPLPHHPRGHYARRGRQRLRIPRRHPATRRIDRSRHHRDPLHRHQPPRLPSPAYHRPRHRRRPRHRSRAHPFLPPARRTDDGDQPAAS